MTNVIAWHCEVFWTPAPDIPGLGIKARPLHKGRSAAGHFWLFRFDNGHGAHVSCDLPGRYDAIHCVYPGDGPQWHCVEHETHRLDILGLRRMLMAIKEDKWLTQSSWTCSVKT